MRAVLRLDAPAGAGYGIIDIYGANVVTEPVIVLKRMSDGQYLGSGGWSGESASISPSKWDNAGGGARLRFGPEVVDDIDPSDNYQITLVGTGSCALGFSGLIQSTIVDSNGAGAYAPPPETPQAAPGYTPQSDIIYEGVEKTPELMPDDAGMPLVAGVAAAQAAPVPRKKHGCLWLGIFLLAIWIGGAWFLWHTAMQNPTSRQDQDSAPFEIIPKSSDSSVVEDSPSNPG